MGKLFICGFQHLGGFYHEAATNENEALIPSIDIGYGFPDLHTEQGKNKIKALDPYRFSSIDLEFCVHRLLLCIP